jgi:hypothetical protein
MNYCLFSLPTRRNSPRSPMSTRDGSSAPMPDCRARQGLRADAGLPAARGSSRSRAPADEISGSKIIGALIYLWDWYGGAPLRERRYSLGNTVLNIAGTREQHARWSDKTIAIGLTEPIGGSDSAFVRTTATWDPATNEWVVNREKIFITYAQSCDAVLALARMIEGPGKIDSSVAKAMGGGLARRATQTCIERSAPAASQRTTL